MAIPILRTKLYIPPVRPEWISRPRLCDRLEEGLKYPITLISAPAGFGKTTLLIEWIARLSRPVAWLSLSEDDRHLTRFWSYVIAALQTVYPDVGYASLAALRSSKPEPINTILTDLLNDIATKPAPVALVLDDYHLAGQVPAIDDSLGFVIEHSPPQVRLIVSSRVDPTMPLSRWRGQGKICELRAADLCFTVQETADYYRSKGLKLSPGDIAILDAKAEGWIAGLQMAALSIQGQDREQIGGFITAFANSHRYVLDYLTDEVLLQQPPVVQTFLLKTAILDRLCGPLCDKLDIGDWTSEGGKQERTARPLAAAPSSASSSQQILEYLERANLFLISLDGERRWYRYHHLFADLMRKRLNATLPDAAQRLHLQASEWYEAQGLIAEAVRHAIAPGDSERAARLIERNVIVAVEYGGMASTIAWLDTLPVEMVSRRPWLAIARAWAMLDAGNLEAMTQALQDAVTPLDDSDLARHILGHAAVVRSHAAVHEGDRQQAMEFAQQALELLPEADQRARNYAASTLAGMLRWQGDLQAALQAIDKAPVISRTTGDPFAALYNWCEKTLTLINQGNLRQAAALCQDAMRLFEQNAFQSKGLSMPAACIAARLSYLSREWNDVETALRHVRRGFELGGELGYADLLIHLYSELAQALAATGDADGALAAIHNAAQIARGVSSWAVAAIAYREANLQLIVGNHAAAAQWARQSGLTLDDEVVFQTLLHHITLARVTVAQLAQQPPETRDRLHAFLTRLLKLAEDSGAILYVIEILTLQAMAHQSRGELDQALTVLERALRLGEPEGFVRTFVDAGAPMGELLALAVDRGIMSQYTRRLLDALLAEHPQESLQPSAVTSPLVEPLSERELQVLLLLARRYSNKEIAAELVISVPTAKRHLQNIYGKLGVHGRREAVARARDIGLI